MRVEKLRYCAQCTGSLMAKARFGGETIDVCGDCGGVWLDDGELQSLVRSYGVRFRLSEPALASAGQLLVALRTADASGITSAENLRSHALLCPFCHGVCFPTVYGFDSGIVMNRCHEGHGVFLDPNELEGILVYARDLLGVSGEIPGELPALGSPVSIEVARLPEGDRPERPAAAPGALSRDSVAQPRLRTTRSLEPPRPLDVKLTISRDGDPYFDAVRSPHGDWYQAREGGTQRLPGEADNERYWVELENGGALVVRRRGLRFEWLLVGDAGDLANRSGSP